MVHFTVYIVIVCSVLVCSTLCTKPNIVMILADDLGWNDISLHGQNQFYTPNIDALGLYGITLQRHYTAPMCTPSRSALMTGRYGYHTGMFHWVIDSDEPWGLPLTEKTLPEVLQGAGYKTRLVGKWHLGFSKKAYTPTNRGFHSFYGYYGPYIDYDDHYLKMTTKPYYERGYDMRNNLEIDPSANGTYATDLFTNKAVEIITQHDTTEPLFLVLSHLAPHTANIDNPLQAPQSEIDKFSYIMDSNRRKLAAMISIMDYGIGEVVKSLNGRNMLNNTIILFMSDNGAPSLGANANFGSNYPLRGQKDSPWEGGSRVAAAICSPLLVKSQRVSKQIFSITDWFKTLAEFSTEVSPNLDGYNIWDALSNDLPSPRKEVVINIDSVANYASIIKDNYKYIKGTTWAGLFDGWLGYKALENVNLDYPTEIRKSEVSKAFSQYSQLSDATINSLRQQATITCGFQIPVTPCIPSLGCLFDIIKDPCETTNLISSNPSKFSEMENRLAVLRTTAVPAENKNGDSNANPKLHNNVWTYWEDV